MKFSGCEWLQAHGGQISGESVLLPGCTGNACHVAAVAYFSSRSHEVSLTSVFLGFDEEDIILIE